MSSRRSPVTREAIAVAGGVEALARKLGITSASVSTWGDVPHRRVPAVSKITGIPPARLRPDIFADPPGATREAAQGRSTAQVIAAARELGLDPDAIAARALSDAVRAEKTRRWQEENREAIEAHNRYVEEHGLPLAKYRMF